MRIFALVLCILSCSQVCSANLLTNGDFETGDLTGWTTFVDLGGLGAGFPIVQLFDTDNNGSDSNAAKFRVGGSSGGVGGMFQTVSFVPGQYRVSVDIAAEAFNSLGNLDGALFELVVNGNVVDSHDFGSLVGTTPEFASLDALTNPGAGNFAVAIRFSRDFGSSPFQWVDNFQVNEVPEPSTIMLAGLGLLGLGYVALQKKYRRV